MKRNKKIIGAIIGLVIVAALIWIVPLMQAKFEKGVHRLDVEGFNYKNDSETQSTYIGAFL